MKNCSKKLPDQVLNAIRVKHYVRKTEKAYVYRIKKYINFHNKRHPKEIGTGEVQAFLAHLALEGYISASKQIQALSALLFSCTGIFYAWSLAQSTRCAIPKARSTDIHFCPSAW